MNESVQYVFRVRDSQRKKFYRMENSLRDVYRQKGLDVSLSIEEVRHLVADCLDFYALSCGSLKIELLKKPKNCLYAYAVPSKLLLRFTELACRPWVVCHEVAHLLTTVYMNDLHKYYEPQLREAMLRYGKTKMLRSPESHGALFTSIYFQLISRCNQTATIRNVNYLDSVLAHAQEASEESFFNTNWSSRILRYRINISPNTLLSAASMYKVKVTPLVYTLSEFMPWSNLRIGFFSNSDYVSYFTK